MSLKARLAAQIARTGPLTAAQYMTACLHDPDFGYYATRPALGEHGDFITAPMVSQLFGELIGLWLVMAWRALGAPDRIIVAEMGPGDGTMMSDILRATRADPEFAAAAEFWLIETSQPLKARQQARLGEAVRWTTRLDETPAEGPLLLVANEILDCLPARQFVRTAAGWVEQVDSLDGRGDLAWSRVPAAAPVADAPQGAVVEVSEAQSALGAALAARSLRDGGAALLVDYGRDRPGFGDTLQALYRHEKVDPLSSPGEADLTVWADFPAVMAAARGQGAEALIQTQAQFLARMGVGARAEALVRARPDRAAVIGRQLDRLVGADTMGELFKVCCLHSPGWEPPGF
ncbi:MAG: class I SAM-dependent methyltransferase [Phenylobacterium sp.]